MYICEEHCDTVWRARVWKWSAEMVMGEEMPCNGLEWTLTQLAASFNGMYGWETARMKGDVSSKARDVEGRRHVNARHKKRLIIVVYCSRLGDDGQSTLFCRIHDNVSHKLGRRLSRRYDLIGSLD